ncbi:ModE family transcriptional regulator [Devosia sp. Root413D1]|uniref:winged helix-turn-helix domain-containing protein n=1 Tax=unclassified Devosia TaxID=196773 RepID=UPI0006FC8222|nr:MULTISPECIES: LysR family transcriptional regulator [unclassified Devosia]KQU95742.1 ModE family transcriptional regulator [Devosia sp. Root105]KQW78119.1 ModE family transcriptional regulator [Devosia sp. Root413D1]
MHGNKTIGLSHLRITLSDNFYIGPGRADLMELIAETGSISEAAKRMGMSYKRAWGLVQVLNEGFGAPLVEASRGGSMQGASLTAAGREVLERYRGMQEATRKAIARDVEALGALHGDMSERK